MSDRKKDNIPRQVWREHQRHLDAIKREIRLIATVRDNINFAARTRPETILQCLALEAAQVVDRNSLLAGGQRRPRWLEKIKRVKERHKALAKLLRHVAAQIESTYGDTDTYPDLLKLALKGTVVTCSNRIPHVLIKELRAHAEELDGFAEEHRSFLKAGTPVLSRETTQTLLFYVHAKTQDVYKHLSRLAKMLNAVYARFQVNKKVTAASLKKIFDRHVKPRIRPRQNPA